MLEIILVVKAFVWFLQSYQQPSKTWPERVLRVFSILCFLGIGGFVVYFFRRQSPEPLGMLRALIPFAFLGLGILLGLIRKVLVDRHRDPDEPPFPW